MNNLSTTITGLAEAIAILEARGRHISACIWGGWTVVNPNAETHKRRDGLTSNEVIGLAKELEEAKNAERPE